MDVRGNPHHPFTRGGLCVKVKNYEERATVPNGSCIHSVAQARREAATSHGSPGTLRSPRSATGSRRSLSEMGRRSSCPAVIWVMRVCSTGSTAAKLFFNRLGATIAERTLLCVGSGPPIKWFLGCRPASIRRAGRGECAQAKPTTINVRYLCSDHRFRRQRQKRSGTARCCLSAWLAPRERVHLIPPKG